jgi:hypothetical protein
LRSARRRISRAWPLGLDIFGLRCACGAVRAILRKCVPSGNRTGGSPTRGDESKMPLDDHTGLQRCHYGCPEQKIGAIQQIPHGGPSDQQAVTAVAA